MAFHGYKLIQRTDIVIAMYLYILYKKEDVSLTSQLHFAMSKFPRSVDFTMSLLPNVEEKETFTATVA